MKFFFNISSLSCRIIFFALTSLLVVSAVSFAGEKIEVTVSGVSDELYDNVLARLTIFLQKDSERLRVNGVKLLHEQAESDIRSAVAPFGYYNPVIKKSLQYVDDAWQASYIIEPGVPVLVQDVHMKLTGAGRDNTKLTNILYNFPLKKGDILNQDIYEKIKKRLVNTAFSEGFLKTAFLERSLKINREENMASIHLVMDTGPQYVFGDTSSDQEVITDELLQRFLPYRKGDPYRPAQLFELQSSLNQTDYFSRVVIEGEINNTTDFAVPIDIELLPPKHLNKYSFGLGYATDTGVKGKIDWSNRLWNTRGHKVSAAILLAELETSVAFRYTIPRKIPRYDTFVHTVGYQDRTWDDTKTQLLTAAVTREYSSPRFKFSTGLEMRGEDYDVGNTSGTSQLLLPSLNTGITFADDILNTQHGIQASVGFLGAVEGFISDATFLQTAVSGKVIVSPAKKWRLIGRTSLGINIVDSIDSLPPSLRFYTGGDSSIRGYKYKSIGPEDSSGTVIGGKFLAVGSVETEHVITDYWSVAAFWDGGSATNDLSLDFYQGVGGGVRFRLPFGQIRADLASAITEDGNPFRFHLTVGGDL